MYSYNMGPLLCQQNVCITSNGLYENMERKNIQNLNGHSLLISGRLMKGELAMAWAVASPASQV